MKMIYPTKDCKYDVGVFCNNFHEIEAELVRMNEIISDGRSGIVNKSTGETIVATDSAEAGFEGLRIFGRSEQAQTSGAQLVESIYIDNKIDVYNKVLYIEADLRPSTQYTISYEGTVGNRYYLNENICDSRNNFSVTNGVNVITFTTLDNISREVTSHYSDGLGWAIFKNDKAGNSTHSFSNVMLNAGSVALPYEPYTCGITSPTPEYPQEIVGVGDGGSVEVSVFGKNLVSAKYGSDNKDYGWLVLSSDLKAIKKGEIYTASVVLEASATTRAYWNGSSGIYPTTGFNVNTGKAKYTLTFEAISDGVLLNGNITMLTKSATGDGVTITASDFQIENGETATEYEPYQKQSAIFTTPNGLPGIKVTDPSLATYTDENGQMWCADEVDLERGVYVQRIGEVDLGTLTWEYNESLGVWVSATGLSNSVRESKLMCETIPYNGIIRRDPANMGSLMNTPYNIWIQNASTEVTPTGKALYILATPIETPLSDEEIAKYKALHTNYPTTTVMNDCGADMEVEYVADTKSYIDRKFEELKVALGV